MWQFLHHPPSYVHLETIALRIAQTWCAQRLPKRRPGLPLITLLISNGQVVYSLDVGGFANLLNGGDEAFCAWVEEVLRLRAAFDGAEGLGVSILFGGEARSFTEGDKPDWEMRMRYAMEDAGELAGVFLP